MTNKNKTKNRIFGYHESISFFSFYPDYLHRLGKYNRSNIGTVYYQSLHGLVPKASLPCPLFQHIQNEEKKHFSAHVKQTDTLNTS